jgi:DNA-directed RNA polymerase specialized sigma24 family protein
VTGRPRVCTDAERLAGYADGRLPPPDCDEIEAHLACCAACRDVLLEVAAFAARERERVVSPAPDNDSYERAIASLAPAERAVLLARSDNLIGFEEIAGTLDVETEEARKLFASAVMKLRVRLTRL